MKIPSMLVTTLLLWVVVQEGFAQEKPDYPGIEAQIQAAYSGRNWKKVLEISQLAIDNRIDYLALRQRAGIAGFWRGDFAQSRRHFSVARRFDHRDSVSLEYRYYNLVYDGRAAEAVAQADEFPTVLQRRLGFRPRQFITSLNLESGIKISSVPNQVGNATYLTIGLEHRISPFVQLYQSLSRLSQGYGSDIHLNQLQYYVRTDLRVTSGWLLSPAFHRLSVNGSGTTMTGPQQHGSVFHLNLTRSGDGWKVFPVVTYSTISNTGNALPDQGPPPKGGPANAESQWQIGLGADYAIHRVRFQGSYEYQKKQLTGTWNPLWNLNAVFTASPTFSIRAGYGYFHTTNFLESTTAIYNNVPDPTTDKTTLLLHWGVGRRTSLYLLGQYERKESTILNQHYHYLTATVGLTIPF
ncbi:hypothetical protein GCM10028803_45330 [Larkinella knui]|uniref:DUF560 domain-containing protein n=1 Tax=Larkinella knui TaxID=2025310 RepID=A0A3P1CPH2_9BACT|nr:hypothetical protein [Larkinella knui]RRB15138.1 hypothetical protein EHT87_11350 [Larkinella knui]